MRHFNPQLLGRKSLRFNGPLPSLLEELTGAGPLYVHARNRMVELATIIPLTALVIDDKQTAFFPEDGLILSLLKVERVHGVTIDCRSRQALALEFATRGEPRSVSIVAIPEISDMERFTRCLHRQPAEILREEEYQNWREDFIIRPVICPCCLAGMEERRSFPERHPLTAIFDHAVRNGADLLCNVISPVMGFSTWLAPESIQFSNGILGLVANGCRSLVEVDLGMCHSLRIGSRFLDGECFSEINLYDSLGQVHLQISVRGTEIESVWRRFCEMV